MRILTQAAHHWAITPKQKGPMKKQELNGKLGRNSRGQLTHGDRKPYGGPGMTQEQKAICREIYDRYTGADNRTQLVQALQENPQWAQAVSNLSKSKFYGFFWNLRRKKVKAAPQAAPAAQVTTEESIAVRYCPHCGVDMFAVAMAIKLAQGRQG